MKAFAYIRNSIFQRRILKFVMVGISGICVNTGILFGLTEFLRIPYLVSAIFAIELSIISNFLLNNMWTWKDRLKKRLFHRVLQYHISVGMTALFANWVLLILFTEVFGLYYLLSNLIGIGVGTLFNFVINDLWTFREKQPSKERVIK